MRSVFILGGILSLYAALGFPAEEASLDELLREQIQSDALSSPVLLKEFYAGRNFRPAWIEGGRSIPAVHDLLNALRQADREGLRPADYHESAIMAALALAESQNVVDLKVQAQLELRLTDAFLTYGTDLVSGRINPYTVDNDWFAGRRTGDLPAELEMALDAGEIRQALNSLLPTHPVYRRMRSALARYRQMEKNGGWPRVINGKPLKKGDRDARIDVLRDRLHREGDLNQKPNGKEMFDAALERALMRFQKRNGLDPDGVLGAETLKALNIPASARVRQLKVNMERCRWLPDDLGRRHIFVNVPSFTLQIMVDNRETMAMKVVVGRTLRQTPVFSSTMTHIIFNPPWSVPVMVARKDVLDHIHEEPGYLASHGFDVYDGYDEGAAPVDIATIDWSSVTAQNLKYKFRQRPGPLNALGRIKFLLPNRFDVYLHDTPSRSLFSKTVRDFSSGCIRVEEPVELAHTLLNDESRWSREKIEAAIDKKGEQTIALSEKIPVHLMYWTAWVDERGTVQFRDDIYGRDASLDEAINREPGL